MAGPAQDAALASTSPAPEVLCVSHVPSTPTPRLEVQFVHVSLATQVKMAATAHRAGLGNTRKGQAVRHAAPVPFTPTRLLLVPIKATVNVILVTRVKTTVSHEQPPLPAHKFTLTHTQLTYKCARARRALLLFLCPAHTHTHTHTHTLLHAHTHMFAQTKKNTAHTHTRAQRKRTHGRIHSHPTPHFHTQV